ncbi:MAG TPA: hypothetical protein VG839_06645 [Asticcacaulis sp.]|nr:hypothetical protein [Asticcacaulis sp.]
MSCKSTAATAALLLLGAWPGLASAQSDMSGMDMPGMPGTTMSRPDMASPSAWQIHSHATLTFVSDNQEGPRGGYKNFVSGMAMLTATRPLAGNRSLQFEAMLSPDAFMGKSGYPLLLQTGESADGQHTLIDRQHPHDLFMGLSATLTQTFDGGNAFVTTGYPGEFAFGPTAFMHRASGETFPTAPLTHHWLDSGHITMGVLTAGVTKGSLKLEISQFTGREPDEKRFDLDPLRLDSTAVRVTWSVTSNLTAQASWARQVSPEALEPDTDLLKQSLSAEYVRKLGTKAVLYSTLAFGRKQKVHATGKPSDGWLFENTLAFNEHWTGLLRAERVRNEELAPSGPWVGKTEIGAIRTFPLNDHARLGFGLVRQFNAAPASLRPSYGRHRDGTVAFMTLKFHAMPQGMSM